MAGPSSCLMVSTGPVSIPRRERRWCDPGAACRQCAAAMMSAVAASSSNVPAPWRAACTHVPGRDWRPSRGRITSSSSTTAAAMASPASHSPTTDTPGRVTSSMSTERVPLWPAEMWSSSPSLLAARETLARLVVPLVSGLAAHVERGADVGPRHPGLAGVSHGIQAVLHEVVYQAAMGA